MVISFLLWYNIVSVDRKVIYMIFVSGIHGVGKDYFLKNIEEVTGVKSYSASSLIEEYGNVELNADKKTKDISGNQDYLLQAIRSEKLPKEYILNGHFCLLNEKGEPERIPIETFYGLNPSKIIILKEKPEIIVERRMARDRQEVSVEGTKRFQDEEIAYGKEVAKKLGVQIGVFDAGNESKQAAQFILQNMNR